eukprot:gene12009-25159_t
MSTNNNRTGKEVRPQWKDGSDSAPTVMKKVSGAKLGNFIQNQLGDITALSLEGCQIEKIEDLVGLSSLQRLNLSKNKLHRLCGLNDTPNLGMLNLSNNCLDGSSSLEDLRYVCGLRTLNIGNNLKITHIQPHIFKSLKVLQAFIANDCNIENISFIKNLSNLTTLILSKNNINNFHISEVGPLSHLTKLSIGHNHLTSIPNLNSCPELQELRINHNQIPNIHHSLLSNIKLKILDISHNKLSNWNDIEKLTQLTDLTNLSIKGNPLPIPDIPYKNIEIREDISSENTPEHIEIENELERHCRRYTLFLFQKPVGKLQKPKIQLIVLDSKRVKLKWSHHDDNYNESQISTKVQSKVELQSSNNDTKANTKKNSLLSIKEDRKEKGKGDGIVKEDVNTVITSKDKKKRHREEINDGNDDDQTEEVVSNGKGGKGQKQQKITKSNLNTKSNKKTKSINSTTRQNEVAVEDEYEYINKDNNANSNRINNTDSNNDNDKYNDNDEIGTVRVTVHKERQSTNPHQHHLKSSQSTTATTATDTIQSSGVVNIIIKTTDKKNKTPQLKKNKKESVVTTATSLSSSHSNTNTVDSKDDVLAVLFGKSNDLGSQSFGIGGTSAW